LLDHSGTAQSQPGAHLRLVAASFFAAYGSLLLLLEIRHHDLRPTPLYFVLFAVPLFFNRLGTFGRYFLPVFLGLFAYGEAGAYASTYKYGVHYHLQIFFDQHLTPSGVIPTVWLQQHLYHGHTGPLETLAVVAYIGHFLVPLILGTVLVLGHRIEAFRILMFTLLTTSIAAMIVYILAPTAPPWLAAQDGYLTGVHHILKTSLYNLDMTSLAAIEGNATKYDVTAAAPSLHTAFPLICLLAAYRARLPRLAVALLAANFVAVVFAIVYTGEHYVFDVVTGGILALGVWALVTKLDSGTVKPSRAPQYAPRSDVRVPVQR
jgi:membrane-associated phospholipid phosphatase